MISDQARRLARFHLDVAYALFQARERADLTMEALAGLSELTPERIAMIEEGDTTSLTEVAQICEALGISITSVLPEVIGSQSTEELTKTNASRFIKQVWNAGNLDLADELVHPDYLIAGVGQGPEAVKSNVRAFREAFPDLTWTIEDVVAEGDRVALRLMLRGTHLGVFRGIAPTGRQVTMQEMVFWRLLDGRLHSGWFQADMLGLRVQLGALPANWTVGTGGREDPE